MVRSAKEDQQESVPSLPQQREEYTAQETGKLNVLFSLYQMQSNKSHFHWPVCF